MILKKLVIHVAPFAGAWIEIPYFFIKSNLACVAPFAGAWIEILFSLAWEIGLTVAPFAGAWIEMPSISKNIPFWFVAPFAGAWIEIRIAAMGTSIQTESHPSRVRGLKYYVLYGGYGELESHPSRVRGLKYGCKLFCDMGLKVAPFAGAWIEMSPSRHHYLYKFGRTLRGCVD